MFTDIDNPASKDVQRMEKILDTLLIEPKTSKQVREELDIIKYRRDFNTPVKELMKRGLVKKEARLKVTEDGEKMVDLYEAMPDQIPELPSEHQKEVEEILNYLEDRGLHKEGKITIPDEEILPLLKNNLDNSLIEEKYIKNDLDSSEEELRKKPINKIMWDEFNSLLRILVERADNVAYDTAYSRGISVEYQGNLTSLLVMEDEDKFLQEVERRREIDWSREVPSKELENEVKCPKCETTLNPGDTAYLFEESFKKSELLCKSCYKKKVMLEGLEE